MQHEDVKREDSGLSMFTEDSLCSAELIIQPDSSARLPGVPFKLESVSFSFFFFLFFFYYQPSSRRIETH